MSRDAPRPEVTAGALRQLLEDNDDTVVTLDAEGRVQDWNAAATAMFGLTRDQVLGQDVAALVPKARRGVVRERLDALRRGEEVPPFEAVRHGPNGTRRAIRIRLVGLADAEQRFAGVMCVVRDVDGGLLHSRRLLRLLDALPVNVVTFDDQGVVTFTAGGATTGGTLVSNELAPGVDLLHTTPTASPLHQALRGAIGGAVSDLELMVAGEVWRCHVAPFEDLEADPVRSIGSGGYLLGMDVTERDEVTDRLDLVLGSSPICLLTFDRDARVTYATGAGYRALGIRPASTIGQSLMDLYGDDPQVGEAIRSTLAGSTFDFVSTIYDRVWHVHYRPLPGRAGAPGGGLVIATDTTVSWNAAEGGDDGEVSPLVSLLERDDLTGLLGRRGLQRRLAQPLEPEHHRALVLVELDGFPLIRDAYGTSAADEVLRMVAAQLRDVLPEHVQLGRWDPDTFLAVVDGPRAAAELEELCATVLSTCREALPLGALPIHVTASVGLAESRTVVGQDLLAPARTALGAAKADGGDRLRVFRPETRGQRATPLLILNDLQRILSAQDFSDFQLHYQPIVELATQQVAGVEALLRWQHPTHGLLGPDHFIAAAEANGVIQDLGLWVLRETCRAAASLQASTGRALAVSVNLSGQQLAQVDLVDRVRAILEAEECPATSLVLEVTESSVTEDIARTAAALEQLKRLGLRIALDDFGTGYSSLLYLKHFPVDIIKIDRSFVAGLGASSDDSAIVASTVSMAENLGILCVAEGIETMDQFRLLRKMSCKYGQGYVFSRPQPLEAVLRWLEEHTETPTPDRRSASRVREPAEVVSRVLVMHREGASLHTIAAALNSQGARTARGARWSSQAIAKVITTSQFPRLRLPE